MIIEMLYESILLGVGNGSPSMLFAFLLVPGLVEDAEDVVDGRDGACTDG